MLIRRRYPRETIREANTFGLGPYPDGKCVDELGYHMPFVLPVAWEDGTAVDPACVFESIPELFTTNDVARDARYLKVHLNRKIALPEPASSQMVARMKREIVPIQYLRGIAACAVVFDHTAGMAEFKKYFGQQFLNGALSKGGFGVDLFFIISGFIITLVSLENGTLAARGGLLAFARKRALRILPLMWIAILSYAGLRLLGRSEEQDWLNYGRALVLWPVGDFDPKNIWTLRYEAIFYVVFAFTFLGPKFARPLLFIWASLPCVFWILGDDASEIVKTLTFGANAEFAAGVLIGICWKKWFYNTQISLPLCMPLFILWFLLFVGLAVKTDLKIVQFPDVFITVAFLAPLVFLASVSRNSFRAGALLGDASYSIYLFHPHIISALLTVFSKLYPSAGISLVVISCSFVAILLGITIHLWVEKPLLNFFQGRLFNKSYDARRLQ